MNTNIKESVIKKSSVIILCAIYAVLLAAIVIIDRGVVQMQTLSFAAIFLLAVFLPRDDLICAMCAIVPMAQLAKLSGSFTVLPFVAIIAIIKSFAKRSTLKSNLLNSYINVKFLITYIIMFSLSAAVSSIRYGSPLNIVPFFVYLLFIYLFMDGNEDTLSLQKKNLCCALFTLSVFIVCVGSVAFPNTVELVSNKGEWTIRNTGFSSVWDFGQNIVISICIIILGVIKTKRYVLPAIAAVGVLGYFLITTGLYTGLVGVAVFLFMFPIITAQKGNLKFLRFFIFAIIAVTVAYFIFNYVFVQMQDLRGQTEDIDNGRFEIWLYYLSLLFNDKGIMLFGVGAGAIGDFAGTVNMLTTHNALIEKLVEMGFIGFILLIINLFGIYRNNNAKVSENPLLVLTLVYLAMGMLQGISGSETMYLLMILGYQRTLKMSGVNDCELKTPYRKNGGLISKAH